MLTQIRLVLRSSLIRVYTVCSEKLFNFRATTLLGVKIKETVPYAFTEKQLYKPVHFKIYVLYVYDFLNASDSNNPDEDVPLC